MNVFTKRVSLFLIVLLSLGIFSRAQAPSSLTYPTPVVYAANVSVVYLAPTVAGNVTGYTITPALPAGLSFNTNTGVISGTPTAASAVTAYTITATGGSPTGSTNTTLTLSVTSNYFNNAFGNVNFGGTGVTITPKVGNGTAVGNKVLYRNVATLSGQAIDAIVTTRTLSAAVIDVYDEAAVSGPNFSENEARFFSPQFTFSAAGSATFDFQFILGGSYVDATNTGTNVFLQNMQLNTYDIDGNTQTNSNQYNEFGNFRTSELGSGSTISPATFNATTGLTRFRSSVITNSTSVIADPTRVRVTYGDISDFSIIVGAGAAGASYFFLDFGAGPTFSTAVASSAPTLDLNTATTGVNNGITGCAVSMPFTVGSQSNITAATTTLNALTVSFPTANVTNGVSEQLLIASATSGGTIPLNFANAAAIPNVVLSGVTYLVTATVASGISTLSFATATTFTLAQGEGLLDALNYNNASATPTGGSRNFTVNVRNAVAESPNALFTASINCVSIAGNVYHDANGLSDNIVNSNGTQFTAAQAYVVRVNPTTNLVIDSKPIAAGGAYTFGTVTAGAYALYVSATAPGAGTSFTAATFPAGGYVASGENLGTGATNDLLVDGKLMVTVGSSGIAAANFGLEIPPVSTTSSAASAANPGGFNAYSLPNGSFGITDADGTIASVTITAFPTGANYIRLNGVTYTNPVGGVCPPQYTCTAWPGSLVVPYTSGNPTNPLLIDPSGDVASSVVISFFGTDNAGISSATSTLTVPFTVANLFTIGGTVWQDYNRNGVKDASEGFTNVAAAGQTLYAVVIQNNNTYSGQPTVLLSTAVTNPAGYSIAAVPSGNNYSVRLISAATQPAAGSIASLLVSNLATNYAGVSTISGATITTNLNTNAPTITITSLAANMPTTSFGIEQTPVSDTKTYTNVNSGSGVTQVSVIATPNKKALGVIYVRSLTMAGTAANGTAPGILTGSDPDGGTAGALVPLGSGASTYSLVIDPTRYTNTGSAAQNATMLIYNGIQLHSGGCQGTDVGSGFCSNYNATTGFWEIPNYDATLLKLVGTSGTTAQSFYYAWKEPSGAIGAFMPYSVAYNFALPLDLVSFDAKNTGGNSVSLQWKTANESNTSHFDIEYSTDGSSFTKAGTVQAAGQALAKSYSFTHEGAAGSNYYRLAMYDIDGTLKYSGTKLVTLGNLRQGVSVHPNPVLGSSSVTISWKSDQSAKAAVSIFESNGRKVFQGTLDASGKAVIPVQNWHTGVYYITLDNGKTKEFSKILVNH